MTATPPRAYFKEPLLDIVQQQSPGSEQPEESDDVGCLLTRGASDAETEARAMRRKLTAALVIAFVFVVVQVVGGSLAGSIAIFADAVHLGSDTLTYAISLWASMYAARKSTSTHTFGYRRGEVLGALASVLLTWLATVILLHEAVERAINPTDIHGRLMFIVAAAGVVVNIILLVILRGDHHHGPFRSHCLGHSHTDAEQGHGLGGACGHDHGSKLESGKRNINMRGATVHAVGDLVSSVGVAIASVLIWCNEGGQRWSLYVDPVCTFIFAVAVIFTTWGVTRDVWDTIMERVPRDLDADIIQADLQKIEGVVSVRDLHVWALTPGVPLLAAHLSVAKEHDACAVLMAATKICVSEGIAHSTIQLMQSSAPCCIPAQP